MLGISKLTTLKPYHIHLRPEHDFNRYFGFILPKVWKYFRAEIKFHEKHRDVFFKLPLPKYFDETNQRIAEYIPTWNELHSHSLGRICFHIYKLYYSLLKDQEFHRLDKYDRNMLLWTTLFHDIKKRAPPAVIKKDPAHPFRGAWKTLYYLNEPFQFVNLSKEQFEEWDKIFEGGFIMKEGVEIQNHAIVPRVQEFLDKYLVDKDFEKELLTFVMLHQSLPMLKLHPHEALLDPLETELPKYFNKRMLRSFRIFLRNDSFSYLLYNPELRAQFGHEIDQQFRYFMQLVNR